MLSYLQGTHRRNSEFLPYNIKPLNPIVFSYAVQDFPELRKSNYYYFIRGSFPLMFVNYTGKKTLDYPKVFGVI